jgi:membrane protein YqaA with SNARE-associated domain
VNPVSGQLPALVLLFGLIFGLNLIPVFAPPTWMALAFIGFEFPDTNAVLLALVAAVAATLGRLTLARLSHWLLREKLLSEVHRANIDIIKEHIEKRTTLTFGVFLFYAFSPLPSNFLFIAYGLTGLPLLRIALPFFIGRAVSYTFFHCERRSGGTALAR